MVIDRSRLGGLHHIKDVFEAAYGKRPEQDRKGEDNDNQPKTDTRTTSRHRRPDSPADG